MVTCTPLTFWNDFAASWKSGARAVEPSMLSVLLPVMLTCGAVAVPPAPRLRSAAVTEQDGVVEPPGVEAVDDDVELDPQAATLSKASAVAPMPSALRPNFWNARGFMDPPYTLGVVDDTKAS